MTCSNILICIFSLCLASARALECPRGWFGLHCIYKCRCEGNICSADDGQCRNGSRCQSGWFGPACQYADLAQSDTVSSRGFRPLSFVTDGREDTCLGASVKEISVKWAIPYQITWLRIHFQGSYLESRFSVKFKTDWNKQIRCHNMTTYKLSNTAVDLTCHMDVLVTQVTLSWDGPSYLCSLYISGGRNVALKQDTKQSSSDLRSFKTYLPSYAVDGETNSDYIYGNCAQTASTDPSPYWGVVLSQNFTVNRYLVYHRVDAHYFMRRTYWFTLQGQTTQGQVVFIDRGAGSTRQNVYRVTTATSTSPVAQVFIRSAGNVRRFTAAPSMLSLCEVEVYGVHVKPNAQPSSETICEHGWYGRNCELRCNCLDMNEACFVSTGGCSSGCAAGYTGESCSQMCPPGSYGQECMSTCSQLCLADINSINLCDHVNGTCLLGCQVGFDGPWCNRTCTPGTYGQGCDYECSELCASDGSNHTPSCHHLHGVCLHGCQPGYQGQMCNQPCKPGQFGQECSLACSQFCLGDNRNISICDHGNGKCLLGCRPGYEGAWCNQTCAPGTFGPVCKTHCPEFCNPVNATPSPCHHIHGTCVQGCQTGYTGQMCDSPCRPGNYGQDCEGFCSELCAVDGEDIHECHHVSGKCLRGCLAGYEGPWCNKTCENSTHGHACSLPCPEFCDVTNIDVPVCHHVDGVCLQGCQVGYTGPTCINKCDIGTFGPGCSFLCPRFCDSSNVSDDVCHHIHGTCLQGCQAGYMGPTCNHQCPPGIFGLNCNLACSFGCFKLQGSDSLCNHVNGSCLFGCVEGYDGDNCTVVTRKEETSTDILYTAWVVVVVTAAVTLAVVGAIIWWRRRQIKSRLLNIAIHVKIRHSSSTENIIKTELSDPGSQDVFN